MVYDSEEKKMVANWNKSTKGSAWWNLSGSVLASEINKATGNFDAKVK
jgi:hypothetical protein